MPPTLIEKHGYTTFQEYTATLIVPAGSLETYRQHPVWGLFTNIVEDTTTAVKEIKNSELSNSKFFDLNGRRLTSKPTRRGIYINNGRKMMIKQGNK